MPNTQMLTKLQQYIDQLDITTVTEERQQVLQLLIDYIQQKYKQSEAIHLNFICTHNSRRSQFSQVWAQVAAYHYGIETHCYSGGVEVTAFNERAIAALEKAGFEISKEGNDNPKYQLTFAENAQPITAFSKLHDDDANARSGFAAVMTCSHADENCPFIAGADIRIPVTYEDPKAFDGTPQESEKYEERSQQIATEMFYVFSKIRAV